MYAWLLWKFAGLPPDLSEGSNDLRIYRNTGEAILRGEVPYRDFFIEYPPGSVPAFVPPALFSDSTAGYITLFAHEMALVLAASLVLVASTARRIFAGSGAWILPSLAFAVCSAMLYPVAVTRYDAVVALFLAVAALCAASGARWASFLAYASLGFGAAAKLVPVLATLPLALANRRAALPGLAVFFGTLALFFAPAALFGGGRFLESFAYHADRGLQVESLGASVLMNLGFVEEVRFAFGAFEVRGGGVDLLASLSLPLTGVLLALTAAMMFGEHRTGRLGPGRFPRYAAALILAFMLGSKVLSPQYVIWLLPLVPLSATGLAGIGVSLLFVAVCWTTTQVFPIHYGALLVLESPGPQLLLARNLLLVVLWAALLFLPSRETPQKEPS